MGTPSFKARVCPGVPWVPATIKFCNNYLGCGSVALWLQQIANIKFSRFLENIRLDLAGSWGAARGQLFVIINFKPAEIIMMLVC